MSGGAFDYMYNRVEETYCGQMEDIELNNMMDDLVWLLRSLEWYKSGDTSEDDYREDVNHFKYKWFNQDTVSRVKTQLNKVLDDFKEEILKSI